MLRPSLFLRLPASVTALDSTSSGGLIFLGLPRFLGVAGMHSKICLNSQLGGTKFGIFYNIQRTNFFLFNPLLRWIGSCCSADSPSCLYSTLSEASKMSTSQFSGTSARTCYFADFQIIYNFNTFQIFYRFSSSRSPFCSDESLTSFLKKNFLQLLLPIAEMILTFLIPYLSNNL